MSILLDAVTKAKTNYVLARTTLEARLREQLREELSNMQAQIDLAVRYAYDAGLSKASIMRALGTKDYHTLNDSLSRTAGVEEIVGYGDVYSLAGTILTVTYTNHGPDKITDTAKFSVKRLADGAILFDPLTPLWDDTMTVKNQAVAKLANSDGFYYQEAVEWIQARS